MLEKVFKAYDIRGTCPDPLSETLARQIGWGSAKFLLNKAQEAGLRGPEARQIAVGRDMRKTSPKMAAALIEGLRAGGADVIDVGQVDTSFIYYAINHLGCAGGIQTTASHNPPQYNGFKISSVQAAPVGGDTGLKEIQKLAAEAPASGAPQGKLEQRDLWPGYIAHVRRFLRLDRPLRVVVDASNGMAGAFVPRIFEGLPNLEIHRINFEMTGEFSHDPNPLVPENMAQTQEAVGRLKADLGVCFDGDADRCMITDETGRIIGCDLLGALFAAHFLKSSPGSAIVYDLRSSRALAEGVKKLGGKPVRGRVGHVFLKKLMRESDGVFGAELSGHMYYRDSFYTDSGAITFAVALAILSGSREPMSRLMSGLAPYAQSGEINFKVVDKQEAIDGIRRKYADRCSFDELDGVTADAWDREGWWLNLRASNTEPMLRLNLEARTPAILQKQLAEVTPMLGEPLKGH